MILADGCFDPLHVGHIAYLREAALWGRPLMVNVAPDTEIWAKGREPFQTRQERAVMMLALDMVHQVKCEDLAEAIRMLHPTVLAKGPDWRGRLPADVLAACQEVGTQIRYTSTQERSCRERLSV